MELVKIVFLIAITTALSVTLTMKTMIKMEEGGTNVSTTTTTSSISKDVLHDDQEESPPVLLPSKRVSRFLAEKERNPRAADRCHKDNDVCDTLAAGKNSTCCNNKCVDLKYDDQNCGACKKKCKYTQNCCRGECVDLAYDKRHCGMCNHRCEYAGYCFYGMCSYA